MLTPREKSPLPENFPRGGSSPRHCGQRAQTQPSAKFEVSGMTRPRTNPVATPDKSCGNPGQILWRPGTNPVATPDKSCGDPGQILWQPRTNPVATRDKSCGNPGQILWRPGTNPVATPDKSCGDPGQILWQPRTNPVATRDKSCHRRESNPRSAPLKTDTLTTWPTRPSGGR